jgi:hypothetical protein
MLQKCVLLISYRFQEEILSSRILVFNDDQVYFKCHNCTWSENSRAETEPLRSTILGSSSSVENIDLKIDPWVLYEDYVRQYSSRHLSYDSDAINAMTGILKRISLAMKCRFLYGLPTVSFDLSIIFITTLFQRRPGFPSYSWSGWKGAVWCERPEHNSFDPNGESQTVEEWLAMNIWIIWYEKPPLEPPKLVWSRDNQEARHADIITRKRKLFKNPLGPQVEGDISQTIPTQDIPELKLPSYSVLQFWTVSLLLRVEKHPVPSTRRANIADRNGKYCGEIFVPDGYEPEYGTPHEFLVLSQTNMSKSKTGDFAVDNSDWNARKVDLFRVMLVRWRDGVAERITVGEIRRTVLRSACEPGPVWKEIVLG